MFGWIKRRLLARKARKAVASVGEWRSQCRDMASGRPVPPAYSPSPSYAPPHQFDPLGINQTLVLSTVLDDGHRSSADCSSSFSSSDSYSSSSSYDSSSSCSSSSSSSWD